MTDTLSVYEMVAQMLELAAWHRDIAAELDAKAAALEKSERLRQRPPRPAVMAGHARSN